MFTHSTLWLRSRASTSSDSPSRYGNAQGEGEFGRWRNGTGTCSGNSSNSSSYTSRRQATALGSTRRESRDGATRNGATDEGDRKPQACLLYTSDAADDL